MTDTIQTCEYCGASHAGMCQKIQAIEYYPDGTVKRIEFAKFDLGNYDPKIWVSDAPPVVNT